MAERASPLAAIRRRGPSGDNAGDPGVRLSETPLDLWQVAFWPDAAQTVGDKLKAVFGAVPPPGQVARAGGRALLRAEPLVWWVLGAAEPPVTLEAEEGALLDISHGRWLIRVEGRDAAALLARFVSIDLRDRAFPDGAHAATGAHHAPLNLIRRDGDQGPGYDLLVGRSFARDFWELLELHARQFGCVVD